MVAAEFNRRSVKLLD